MSVGLLFNCDTEVEYGTCAQQLYTCANNETDAQPDLARAGWTYRHGKHRCPGCSMAAGLTTPRTPDTGLRTFTRR